MKSVFVFLASAYLASCFPPPHPAVVAVRREEEHLPGHLRSPALHNPRLQDLLPLTSLLHQGESPVYEREADKVSRQEIYNILTHAGFFPRRHLHLQPDPNHRPHQRVKGHQHSSGHQLSNAHHHLPNQQVFHDRPFFPSPDVLQHL